MDLWYTRVIKVRAVCLRLVLVLGRSIQTVWQNLPFCCPPLLLLPLLLLFLLPVIVPTLLASVQASSACFPLNVIPRSACASSRPQKMWLSLGVLCVKWTPGVGLLNQMWTAKKSAYLEPGSIACEGTLRWLLHLKVIITHFSDRKSASVE